ncbi:hypothetical protein DPMN_159643 [Dreissena polymorpha]|uniref:Uncharacterized protein n=1 Tax=Dreissena polymorpha TaxID=45954 RepID=A0A9D4ELU6_DREPO|nr:hypothetical protein DPMN_159643 [Dreissena polymorpha]
MKYFSPEQVVRMGNYFDISDDSRELTRKNAQLPGDHVSQQTGTNFDLSPDIIYKCFDEVSWAKKGTFKVLTRKMPHPLNKINVLTKFHKHWLTNKKNAPLHVRNIFQQTGTILKLI